MDPRRHPPCRRRNHARYLVSGGDRTPHGGSAHCFTGPPDCRSVDLCGRRCGRHRRRRWGKIQSQYLAPGRFSGKMGGRESVSEDPPPLPGLHTSQRHGTPRSGHGHPRPPCRWGGGDLPYEAGRGHPPGTLSGRGKTRRGSADRRHLRRGDPPRPDPRETGDQLGGNRTSETRNKKRHPFSRSLGPQTGPDLFTKEVDV